MGDRAALHERRHRGLVRIVDVQANAGALEPFGDRRAHLSQSKKSNVHGSSPSPA